MLWYEQTSAIHTESMWLSPLLQYFQHTHVITLTSSWDNFRKYWDGGQISGVHSRKSLYEKSKITYAWSSQQKEWAVVSNIFVKGISLFVADQPTRTSEVLCSLSILLPEGPSAHFWAQSRVAWSPGVNTTWWYGRDSRDAEALHRNYHKGIWLRQWQHVTRVIYFYIAEF